MDTLPAMDTLPIMTTTCSAPLYFTNPCELDMRLAQLFGVNVKLESGAIGYFGTGLKYAIAVTLRLGGTIEIWSGTTRYEFRTEPTCLRGKEFALVYMHSPNGVTQMPFTLELGKHWKPWMAYRELWANARDEGGTTSETHKTPTAGHTLIVVNCPEIFWAHEHRQEFLLESKPLWASDELEIHFHAQHTIFYRGLKILELEKLPCYTYNVLAPVDLTEDRTASNSYALRHQIMRALTAAPPRLAEPIICPPTGSFEERWDWDWIVLSAQFNEKVHELVRARPLDVNPSLHKMTMTQAGPVALPEVKLTKVEALMLDRAISFLAGLSHDVVAPIKVVEHLGEQVLGMAMGGEIYLARAAFRAGTKQVALTVLEEHIHLTKSLRDMTRGLQNYLFELVVSLGEELTGEPL